MAGLFSDLKGTLQSFFKIGLGGVRLKNSNGNLVVRNSDDSADASVTTSLLNVSGSSVILDSDSSAPYTLQSPSGMTGPFTLTLPSDDGFPGQALITDGNGNLSFGAELGNISVYSRSLSHGMASPVGMFTLPENAVVHTVDVIVDTTFDGTPTLSVGTALSTSKYMSIAQNDLTSLKSDRYQSSPGEPPSDASEDLQISYSNGGATFGEARVLVYWSLPIQPYTPPGS